MIITKTKDGRDHIRQKSSPEQNGVYSLIIAIVITFISPHPEMLDRSKDLLINLMCHSLTHFR